MDNLLQDVRYGARRLARSPGFTLIAVLTLALGIGANSAIFSVVNAVLLRSLPYAEPDRLVRLFNVRDESDQFPVAPPNYFDFREQRQLFSGVAAYDQRSNFTLTGVGEPQRVTGAEISAELFDVLGVRPVLGRGLRPGENEPGAGDVVVLSHGAWQQYFGGDPGVIGRTISLDGATRTVVGVMPAGFDFPEEARLWTPLVYDGGFRDDSNRGSHYLSVVARLQPDVTTERAAEEMETLGDRIATEYGGPATNSSATAMGFQEVLVGDIRPALLVLLGAVGLVLLIACANVANLMLARAATREGELAVRAALGAGRRRLLRQLLTESVLLALLGGAAGLLIAFWGTAALVGLRPEGIPRIEDVTVDPTVIAFTAGLSLLTGLVFGLVPAIQLARADLTASLREGARGALSGRRGNRVRAGLVVAEMAVAVILLAGAGLLIRSFQNLTEVDPGFRPEGVVATRLSLPPSSYADDARAVQLFDGLLERLRALPGVTSAGAVSILPMAGGDAALGIYRTDRPTPTAGVDMPIAKLRVASPDYFGTLGIPLLRGRDFAAGDRAGASRVVVLTEQAAERIFPGEEAIGKQVSLTFTVANETDAYTGEVVGIVGSVRQTGLDDELEPEAYVAMAQVAPRGMEVTVRTSGDPAALAGGVRDAVRELDPELPVSEIRTVAQVVSESVSQPRFYMLLLTVFASVALVLAAVGIFGVISYTVAQRTREIGVRMALGAEPGQILRMTVGRALLLGGGGVVLGLVAALGGTRLLAGFGFLFQVGSTDPLTYASVAAILLGVAALASYLPARRATRVDPMAALRAD